MSKKMIFAATIVLLVASAFGQQSQGSSAMPALPSALPETPSAQVHSSQDMKSLMRANPRVVADDLESQPSTPLNGARAQLHLVSEVSSKLPNGSAFQARLDEPLIKDGQQVLPKGTVFEGHLQTRRARHAMRPGSMFMMFDRVLVPSGRVQAVSASLLTVDNDAVKTDREGGLHPALSKRRLLIQLGGTALAAKFGDDLAQVAAGTAVSASTARYIGAAAATTFFLFQRGREVKLHPGDTIEVEFGRSGSLVAVPGTEPIAH